jgi:hypothetical protein
VVVVGRQRFQGRVCRLGRPFRSGLDVPASLKAERNSEARLLVFVAVMKVWIVRMPVTERLMPVPVRMRLGDHAFVRVLMMGIVDMAVFVLDRLMHVVMLMAFGQMQPEAKSHQRAGEDELSGERIAE